MAKHIILQPPINKVKLRTNDLHNLSEYLDPNPCDLSQGSNVQLAWFNLVYKVVDACEYGIGWSRLANLPALSPCPNCVVAFLLICPMYSSEVIIYKPRLMDS
jgi:hypothetical protein